MNPSAFSFATVPNVSLIRHSYGRGAGVGRTPGAGVALGIGVGEAGRAQYLPPVFVTIGGVLAASASPLGFWLLR